MKRCTHCKVLMHLMTTASVLVFKIMLEMKSRLHIRLIQDPCMTRMTHIRPINDPWLTHNPYLTNIMTHVWPMYDPYITYMTHV